MKVLILGAGIGGLATSIVLAKQGHDVTLFERGDHVVAIGSGITLIGAALRALHELEVLDDCLEVGYPVTEFEQRVPSGELVSSFTMPSPVGQGGPGMMGMTRPDLHSILLRHAQGLGVDVRTSTAPESIDIDDDSTTVCVAGAEPETFDLVVGADGLRSWTRTQLFGDIEPTLQSQMIYRIVLERPEHLVQEVQFVGHPTTTIGFTPTGEKTMYMYLLIPASDDERAPQEQWPEIARGYLEPFGGVVAEIRDQVTDPSKINFQRFRTIIVPTPWFRGRTVLLGDAAHATTPHLAAGGAMCLEDALVLGEELAKTDDVSAALAAYTERRYPRTKFVVETSAQLSRWGVNGEATGEQIQGLIYQALGELAAPY